MQQVGVQARLAEDAFDIFEFEAEPAELAGEVVRKSGAADDTITILSVDDDPAFQDSLRLSLSGFRYRGIAPRILTAQSATQAAKILVERRDIAVMLLDVVMETDDAGLRLVRNIRESLGNAELRIVLLTGQPGMAPMQTSLEQYDISDYWLKTDITSNRLHSILVGNLRTWEQIRRLDSARRGLQAIVEASNSLARATGFNDFCVRVINELAALLGVEADGIVCVRDEQSGNGARIIGSGGRFASAMNEPLSHLADAEIRALLTRALRYSENFETKDCQVLFFPGTDILPATAAYLATGRNLDQTERELLGVFATNVGSGLLNVALTSRLDRIAFEDDLLGIPNRNALIRAVDAVLQMSGPRRRTLLFVEADQYSRSCVSLGMEQGDLILQAIAKRLCALFPPPCMVARLHEDTFAILGPSEMIVSDGIDWTEPADDFLEAPFIGVETARLDLDLFEGSARSAVAAGLLLIKRERLRGGGRVAEYMPEMEKETRDRFDRACALYHALKHNEIQLAFQPQIDFGSGRVVGVEALARWTRMDGTVVPPDQFIPLAEANGLIVPLGYRIIEQACRALQRLATAGHSEVTVAVNVSPLQLVTPDFAEKVIQYVERYEVEPSRLELEITESVAMDEHESAQTALHELTRAGFPIAIDDFGTGYSSLKMLLALQPAKLKIDRSFVSQIGRPSDDEIVAEMILNLGGRLGLTTVAEGVETEEQAEWLRRNGCHIGQGFLFARPESFIGLLERMRG